MKWSKEEGLVLHLERDRADLDDASKTARYTVLQPHLPLDCKCELCGGSGKDAEWAKQYPDRISLPCSACTGKGFIPTDEGNKLLEFLRRHLVVR